MPIVLILIAFNSISQNQSTNPLISQSFSTGDYEKCIMECNLVLNQDDNNSQANLFKGASLIRTRKYSDAEPYLNKAKTNNFQPAVIVNSNMLLMHAGLKHTKEVLSQLKEMAENGFGSLVVLNANEFDYLKDNESFAELKSKVDSNANPCKYGMDYKKLDFWLGEWDVYVNGNKTAESFITKSMGGCTLHEDYRTLSGYFGRSYNYFDSSDNLYTQIWIDKFNGKYVFKEKEAKEGYLLMLADQGEGNLVKMSYEKDIKTGNVTQIMESSADNGETWTLSFTGIYKNKMTN